MITEIIALSFAVAATVAAAIAESKRRSLSDRLHTEYETRYRQLKLDYDTCRAALAECADSREKCLGDLEVAQARLTAANEAADAFSRQAEIAEGRVAEFEAAVFAYHEVLTAPYGVNVEAIRQRLFDLVTLEDPGDKVHDVQRVDLKPGDLVVTRVPESVPAEAIDKVVTAVRKRLPVEVEVMAIPDSMSLEIIGRNQAIRPAVEKLDLDEPVQFVKCAKCGLRFGGDAENCPACGEPGPFDLLRDESSTEGSEGS